MTLRWISNQLLRHRMTGLLVVSVVTLLLMLLATQSLHPPRHRDRSTALSVERTFHGDGHGGEIRPATAAAKRDGGSPASRLRPPDSPREHPAGRKRRIPPVVFLKTHKTGSSTVQNILFRLGETQNATFAFPYYTYQFSYPERFRAVFVDELPEGASQFDMLCSHMRLDLEQLGRVMPLNAVYLTLLRDPVSTFESVFSYYTSTVPAFVRAQKHAEEANLSDSRSALSVFLESPDAYWDPAELGNGLAKNPMGFDLGLNNREWNGSWHDELARLEKKFHLVMVAEHFEESLILMKELLELELEDLVYVRLNARRVLKATLPSEEMKARIRSWNNLDVLLYDFFLRVFWEKARQYGHDRLRKEVSLLRAAVKAIRRRCLARELVPPEELEDLIRPWQSDSATILGYELRGNLTEREQRVCVRLVLPELQYHSHLYFQQYGRDMRSVPTD